VPSCDISIFSKLLRRGNHARFSTLPGPRVLFLVCASAHAQNATVDSSASNWSFSAAANYYVIPDSRDYLQPTIAVKRGWLHLEVRYNYENLETGSLWFGYNIVTGKSVTMEFTPMVSGVIGR